jgi:hypothetical protein
MKPETHFYMEIKHCLQDIFGDKHHYQRFESGETAQGIPDINVCFSQGHELWLEAKVHGYLMTPLQKGWMKRRQLAGGHVYLIKKDNENSYCVFDGEHWSRTCATVREAIATILYDAFNIEI